MRAGTPQNGTRVRPFLWSLLDRSRCSLRLPALCDHPQRGTRGTERTLGRTVPVHDLHIITPFAGIDVLEFPVSFRRQIEKTLYRFVLPLKIPESPIVTGRNFHKRLSR